MDEPVQPGELEEQEEEEELDWDDTDLVEFCSYIFRQPIIFQEVRRR
jgi:hypothetical protein